MEKKKRVWSEPRDKGQGIRDRARLRWSHIETLLLSREVISEQ